MPRKFLKLNDSELFCDLNRKVEIQPCIYIIMEKVLWVKADILIHQIVGAASTKAVVTAGVNAPLTFGKETETTNASVEFAEVASCW
jgi:hypothetical protein